jgi:hypothetical protein
MPVLMSDGVEGVTSSGYGRAVSSTCTHLLHACTHIAFQLGRLPSQEPQKHALWCARVRTPELEMRILDIRWQILTHQVLVYVYHHSKRRRRVRIAWGARRRRVEQQTGRRTKEGEEGCDETTEDEVYGGEETVGSDLGAPGCEDGVSGFEDAKVDGVVGRGEGGYELLWKLECQYGSRGRVKKRHEVLW